MPILADRVVSRFLASTTAVVFDEKKRRAVAEEALRLSLAKQQGKAMPAMTEDLVLWIKSGGPDTDVRRVMAEHAASTLTDAQLVEAFMGHPIERCRSSPRTRRPPSTPLYLSGN